MMVCLPLFFDLERPNSVCREGGFTPPRHTEAMQNRVKITNFLQLEEYSLGIIIISYWVGSIINNMSLNYVYWAHMSHKWAQNILPELWLRLVRLGWHIIYNSATQPEVSIQPITKDGFMGWPCKEAQSGSIVTIYTCMGLPTMYNSVSSGAILALRHFRYSRISADIILSADIF